ncbi:MAG: thioesterase domain-containing protein, partial [Nitrococcus sp.]|nr:thioesterase domain-containing protein [Nitrococcus sp.]
MLSSRVTLFCLACAGASAAPYARWSRLLPAWIRVCPLERPGRGARANEAHIEDYHSLVGVLADDIMRDHSQSYALFGHSLGALLAYGCAHRLRQLGARSPSALLIAGSAAPAHRDDAYLAELSSDAQVIDELRRQGGTPEEVFADPDMLRLTVDTAAADFAACASFRPFAALPLTVPIYVYSGRADTLT